ncbi:LacI family transcriptional regulator [Glycomyces sp. TRM65418]|uniref:LacI family DNA-binding transcriptional regulator n=1 Tax=Glycomyces sp. TRM65418 TaxID=2867006 RepID=UPI001CE6F03E|nr:LacI family DNA-binding transcriptional regulator [Glycomyces sp. TRM65418]MCC3763535.1 LacI family transcriptional regulator [Glycomyces sp. TRM65418]QZD57518.1 LacI family transcriptional regulator [Glycomyces sp. TRM65418]
MSADATPTLEDVARVAGVSRATVSRVINQTRNVDPAIQEAVRRAVAATGYVPNRAARSLVTRRSDAIGVVVAGAGPSDNVDASQVLTDPFFGRILTGIIGSLRLRGIYPSLMLAETEADEAAIAAHLKQGNADGALLISTHAVDRLPALVAESGRPAVRFARPPQAAPVSYVDLANRDGGALAADRLASLGRRRPAAITGPLAVPAAHERQSGYLDRWARRGCAFVPSAEGNFTYDSGERAMKHLLTEHPDVDAVFAASDLMAQGAIHTLHDHGRRVPEDVAVVGFDDSAPARLSRPPITTVRQPLEDMGAEMVRLLLERIADPSMEPTSVIFEPELVVRESA